MTDLSNIKLADLPPKLAEVASHIGLIPALELTVTWPGVRLFVPKPKQMTPDHPIALQIGLEAATQLAEVYGGTELTPPRGVFARLERRQFRARVVAEFRAGSPASQLAAKYGVHEVSIYRWAAASEDPE